MLLKKINVGVYANDESADTLVVAYEKINENFIQIEAKLQVRLKAIVFDGGDHRTPMIAINENFKTISAFLKTNN